MNPDDEDPECETATSSVCRTTISQAPTTTITTATCKTVTSCSVTSSASTTTTSACQLSVPTPGIQKRAPAPCGRWAVIYPRNQASRTVADGLQRAIDALDAIGRVHRSQARYGSNIATLFWAVEFLTDDQMKNLQDNHPEVRETYEYIVHTLTITDSNNLSAYWYGYGIAKFKSCASTCASNSR